MIFIYQTNKSSSVFLFISFVWWKISERSPCALKRSSRQQLSLWSHWNYFLWNKRKCLVHSTTTKPTKFFFLHFGQKVCDRVFSLVAWMMNGFFWALLFWSLVFCSLILRSFTPQHRFHFTSVEKLHKRAQTKSHASQFEIQWKQPNRLPHLLPIYIRPHNANLIFQPFDPRFNFGCDSL